MRNGRLLVAERPVGKPYSGFWEFPGGKVEDQESGEQTLRRELHEELGVEVTASRHLFNHTHVYPDKTVLLEVWLVTEFTGEPQGQENQALRWVLPAEITQLPLLEGNWAIIDKIISSILMHDQ